MPSPGGEAVGATKRFDGAEGSRGDVLVEKTLKLAVHQFDAVKCLEVFAGVAAKISSVADDRAMYISQVSQLVEKFFSQLSFRRHAALKVLGSCDQCVCLWAQYIQEKE